MTKSIDVYIEPFRVTITTCARQQVNRVRKQTANVKRSNDLLCSVISSNVSLKSIVSFLILLFPSLAIIPEGMLHPRPPRPPRKNSEFEPNFLPFLFPFSRVQRPDLSNRSGDLLRPSRYHVRSERIRRVLDGSLAAGARAGEEGEGERSQYGSYGDRYALFSQDHDTRPTSFSPRLSNCLCTRAVFYLARRLPANETPADLRIGVRPFLCPAPVALCRAGPQTRRSKRAYLNGGNVE